jgi:Cysteine-rich CPCC
MNPVISCPCCGYLTFSEKPGSYEICPICFWEDDQVQLRWPALAGGANKPSLADAQKTFATIGACEERLLGHVRRPGPADAREPGWRPVTNVDSFEPVDVPEADWPPDLTVLYWWRSSFWRAQQGAEPSRE